MKFETETIEAQDSNWESREQEIFEKIGVKIATIKELKNIVGQVDPEATLQSVASSLREYLKKISTQFPEVQEKIEQRKHARHIFEQLYKNLYEGDPPQHEKGKREELLDQLDHVDKQLHSIASDDDVAFLDAINSGTHELLKKFMVVQRVGKDQTEIVSHYNSLIGQRLENPLEETMVENINTDPFSIEIEVKREDFQRIVSPENRGACGLHYRDTPYNIIRSGDKYTQAMHAHERIHNFLDGFIDVDLSPEVFLKHQFELLSQKWQGVSSEAEKIELHAAFKRAVAPHLLLRLFRSEMIADAHAIREDNSDFTTANKMYVDAVEFLRTQKKLIPDKEIREFVNMLIRTLPKRVYDVHRTMSEILFTGERMGDPFEAEAILTLLSPEKYRHAKRYFKNKYGEETLKNSREILYFLNSSLKKSSFERILQLKEKFTAADQDRIVQKLAQVDIRDFLKHLDTMDVAAVRAEIAALDQVVEKFSPENLERVKTFEAELYAEFFTGTLYNAIERYNHPRERDYFRSLVSTLTLEEKREFSQALENYFFSDGSILTKKAIRELPWWNTLRELGLEDVALKGLSANSAIRE